MNQRFLTFIFVAISSIICGQETENYLRCIEVLNNNETRIHWVQPSIDQADFERYEIFVSGYGQSYTLAKTFTEFDQTIYTHPNTTLEEAPWRFYLITHAGEQLFSDTLTSIVLSIEDLPQDSVGLSWNPPREPHLPSASEFFQIYRENDQQEWILIDSTDLSSYFEKVCTDEVNYRIEVIDTSNCSSLSYETSFAVENPPPADPVMDSVSITLDKQVIIGWEPVEVNDIANYRVDRFYPDGSWRTVGYAEHKDSTFLLDDAPVNPCNTSYKYALVAIDSCGNASPGTYEGFHHTMKFNYSSNPCSDSVFLQWSAYIRMKPELGGYRIFYSQNGTAYEQVGSTPRGDTTFIHVPDVEDNDMLCYFIQAYSSDESKTASTCRICFTTEKPEPPDSLYIQKASVNWEGEVDMAFVADETAYVPAYLINRRIDGNSFQQIDSLGWHESAYVSYSDPDVNASQQPYHYQILARDSCYKDAIFSNTVKTIHLSGEVQENRVNRLQWNQYIGFEKGADKYQVVRYEQERATKFIEPATGKTNYDDDISQRISGTGIFTYRIRAIGNETSLNTIDTVWSNPVVLQQIPGLYMPNAFSPNNDGKNDIFRPLFVFIPEVSYVFRIYNRWGELIFESRNKSRGWDGKHNGKPVEPGTYVYQVQYSGRQGNTHKKVGNVTLVR